MARRNTVEILYETRFDDRGARAAERSTERQSGNFEKLAGAIGAAAIAYGAARTAQLAYNTAVEGADLIAQREKFDALAGSIGTTADALMGDLKTATSGMISDAELVSSASELMSMGLVSTHDEAVRLSAVIGKLGWDMEMVSRELISKTGLRLDSLGLSMQDVKARADELAQAGYDLDQAYTLAVVEAGEQKTLLLGDTAETTAGKIKILEARLKDVNDEFKATYAAELAEDIGLLAEGSGEAAEAMELLAQKAGEFAAQATGGPVKRMAAVAMLEELVKMGEMSRFDSLIQQALLFDPMRIGAETDRLVAQVVDQYMSAVGEIEAVMSGLEGAPTQGPLTLMEYLEQAEKMGPRMAVAADGTVEVVNALIGLAERGVIAAETLELLNEVMAEQAAYDAIQKNQQAARDAIERTSAVLDIQRQRAKDAAAALGGEYAIAVRDVAENAGDEDGGAANAIGDLNQEMFNLIEQAGGGPQLLFNWAEQTDLLGQEALEASLKVFALRQKMQELATKVANRELSIGDAITELNNFKTELDGVIGLEGTYDYVFGVSVPGIQDLRDLRDFLNGGGTVNPGDPLFGPGSPSIDQPSDNRPPPSSSTPPPPPGDATPPPGAFALGGTIAPGWNIVGEQGPEMLHGTTGEVIPANSTRMLAGGGGGGSTSLNQNITLVSQDNNTAALQAALIAKQSREALRGARSR